MPKIKSIAACAVLSLLSTLSMSAETKSVHVETRPFGALPDGRPVSLFVMTAPNGVEVAITNYGGRVVSLKTPDKSGKTGDIVTTLDDLKGYLGNNPFFGALVGRYANRIAHAQFTLDGKTYKLAQNDGANTLHGGLVGFDKVLWNAKASSGSHGATLELTYLSKDLEENFPGNLTTKVTYTLTPSGEVHIDYSAHTDKDTVINLTNHTYFNLDGSPDILGHQVTLYASHYTPVDSGLIPTGELRDVKGTPFDFLTPHAVGERIEASDEQLTLGKGYDHNWVLDSAGGKLAEAAEVYDSASGRVLQVWTTQPGIQFYSGNFLDGTITGKGGKVYGQRSGFCLETQHFPDSPNHPSFPTTELKAGARYHSVTEFRFSTR